MNCYDGGTCVQWRVCKAGDCAVREQVEEMRSREFEEAQTQRIGYTGEETQIINHVIDDPAYGFVLREDLSLSEDEVAGLQSKFDKVNGRVANTWIQAPSQPQIQHDHNRRHICFVCMVVSWLPGHHRCPHGRLVCERCELEAAGW